MTNPNHAERDTTETGSPSLGELVFLAVGRLQRPHGLRGEIIMEVLTDFPERLEPGLVVHVGVDHRPERILNIRWHGKKMLITLEGYETREQAGELRNQFVMVPSTDRPALPEGEYYHHQLLGLSVITVEDQLLGVLVEILETGANDVFVIRSKDGKEVLLPAIDEVVLKVDLDLKEMRVKPLPGLIPE